MKYLFLLAIIVAVCNSYVTAFHNPYQSPFNVEKWTHEDIIDYLKDESEALKELSSQTYEDLKDRLSEKFSMQHHEPTYLDKLSQKNHEFKGKVAAWLIETWTTTAIHRLLDSAGIQFDPTSSRDKLISTFQDNFDAICKQVKSSGYYPSSSFYSDWTVKDLQDWLNKYNIQYSADIKDKRDDLLALVKKNAYQASQYAEEKRMDMVKKINELAGDELFSKKDGKLNKDVFEHWSNIDLQDWLQDHGVPIDEAKAKGKKNHKYLTKIAQDNINLLQDDVDWYTQKAARKATPILYKPANYMSELYDNAVGNQSIFRRCTPAFLQHWYDNLMYRWHYHCSDLSDLEIKDWNKKRLQDYLDVRGVKYHTLTTMNQLRRLVNKNQHKPIIKTEQNVSKLFNKLPISSIQQWLKDNNPADKIDQLNKETQVWKDNILEKWYQTLDSWSVEELSEYLNSFGVVSNPTATKNELIDQIKSKTRSFFGYPEPKPFYKRWLDKVYFH